MTSSSKCRHNLRQKDIHFNVLCFHSWPIIYVPFQDYYLSCVRLFLAFSCVILSYKDQTCIFMALQNETRSSELHNSSGDDVSRFCTNIVAIDYLLPVETTVALVTQASPFLKSCIPSCRHLQALLSYEILERFLRLPEVSSCEIRK